MNSIDLAILIAYLVGVTVFGCLFCFRKGAKGSAGFVAGGGRVPSWAIVFGTCVLFASGFGLSFLSRGESRG